MDVRPDAGLYALMYGGSAYSNLPTGEVDVLNYAPPSYPPSTTVITCLDVNNCEYVFSVTTTWAGTLAGGATSMTFYDEYDTPFNMDGQMTSGGIFGQQVFVCSLGFDCSFISSEGGYSYAFVGTWGNGWWSRGYGEVGFEDGSIGGNVQMTTYSTPEPGTLGSDWSWPGSRVLNSAGEGCVKINNHQHGDLDSSSSTKLWLPAGHARGWRGCPELCELGLRVAPRISLYRWRKAGWDPNLAQRQLVDVHGENCVSRLGWPVSSSTPYALPASRHRLRPMSRSRSRSLSPGRGYQRVTRRCPQVPKKMGALGRVELPTNGLGNRCSIHLSYRAVSQRLR